MKFFPFTQKFVLVAVLASGLRGLAAGQTNAAPAIAPPTASATARDFYNAGTRLLAAKKFADAEKMFQAALAAQDERVQPAAMYNVGHARFAIA